MLVFELDNGSIINLLSWQSMGYDGTQYTLTCMANKIYNLTEAEFNIIKSSILEFVPEDSIYKFDDNNIVNLIGFESLSVIGETAQLILCNGTRYELSIPEFNQLKNAIGNLLQTEN